jgi:DNA-binding NtrC family response regulator
MAVGNAERTVLLVDDEELVRRLVRVLLQLEGFQVLEASHGEEALRMSATHPGTIDLMVSDVTMPGVRGPELARRLEAQRPEMKVLFMSGYPDVPIPTGAPFLPKPFTAGCLQRKVQEILAAG